MPKIKKTYHFGVISAVYITLFSTLLVAILQWCFLAISWKFLLIFAVFIAFFSFFVMQYRAEHFIYRRLKKIYNEVSILDASNFTESSVTTDMKALTQEVKKFATNRKLEIQNLKERENYRREFMGNVSHELKTPLFTVQGYIDTLLDGGAMKDKTLRKKYLERAQIGVERLVFIVEDLDMISKLEMGENKFKFEKFDIIQLVQEVFDLLEMTADKKNIILMFDQKYTTPIFVNADKGNIQQVLTNLITNSIKYGKENGTTEVAVEDLTESKIIVRVRDDGEGIEEKNITRIFERFYRVDKSGSRAEGGSGLGLSIVKHIIEGHNQKVYVQSKIDKGSEFSFTLDKFDLTN